MKASRRNGRSGKQGRGLSLAMMAAMILLLVGVLWYAYPREVAQQELLSVPVITASAGPYKIVPENPGGMAIPYRDSTVFEALRAGRNDGAGKIENLLEDSEAPVSREDLFAGLKSEVAVPEKTPEKVEEVKTEIKTVGGVPREVKAFSGPLPDKKPQMLPQTKNETSFSKKPVKKQGGLNIKLTISPSEPGDEHAEKLADIRMLEPASGVEKKAVVPQRISPVGNYFVQLGSLRSNEDAEKHWTLLQREFSAQLNDLGHRIKKADLGSRGIYYRLQGGPVSEPQARDICSVVSMKRAGGCLVIKH